MIASTPPPSIEVSLFGAVDSPSTSEKAKEALRELETCLEGLSGRPGVLLAEREVRIRCPAGGELRLRRPMEIDNSSSPTTEWALTQVGPPVRGRGAATLPALARPVTGVVLGVGGVSGRGAGASAPSSSFRGPVQGTVSARHAPAFFASAGFGLDFGGDGGGGGGGEVVRLGRRYRLFRSGGSSGGAGAGGTGAAAGGSGTTTAAATTAGDRISKGGASSGGVGVVVDVELTESFSPSSSSPASALGPEAAGGEGSAAADAAAIASSSARSFVGESLATPSAASRNPQANSCSPRHAGVVLVSVSAVASESDYAAAAAQVGALASVLRPWVELRKS